MVRAFASPPPLLSGGSLDRKGPARKFLERALVISALVHLTAAGLFRAADERDRAGEAAEPVAPTWTHIVDVGPKIIPLVLQGMVPRAPTDGVIVPTSMITAPAPVPIDYGSMTPGAGSDPVLNTGGDGRVGDLHLPPPPPEADPGFKAAEVAPVPTYAPLPVYPDFAREAGVEGRVIVHVLVGTDGVPKQVIGASGSKLLIPAAVEGVKRWRFKPGTMNGTPIEVWMEIPVQFHF